MTSRRRWSAGSGKKDGLGSAPCVSRRRTPANPHYLATAAEHRLIREDELVLLDLWGKLADPGAVYADITWIGFAGKSVPEKMTKAFAAITAARDAAVSIVQDAAAAGREVRGYEADRAARRVLIEPATKMRSCIEPVTAWRERPRKWRAPRRLRDLCDGVCWPGSALPLTWSVFQDFGADRDQHGVTAQDQK